MSIEQIDEKLKCIMIQINDVANELYQSDPQRCSRLKVAGLNLGCVRADIERAAALAGGQKPTTNTVSAEIKPCSRLSDCACVRIEGTCKGPSCGVYDPA